MESRKHSAEHDNEVMVKIWSSITSGISYELAKVRT